MNSLSRAHLSLFTVNLIYGANYLIAKGLMPDKIGPSGFILLRVLGAVLLFWLFFGLIRKGAAVGESRGSGSVAIDRSDIPRFVVCGLFGVAANQLLFFNGLSLTSPINSAVIMTSNPIIVLVLSAIILRERLPWIRISGVFIGAVGAVSLIYLSKSDTSGYSDPLGDILILLNSASYAMYLVLVKPLMKKYSPLKVISWVFVFGAMFVLPFGFEQFSAVNWSDFSSWDWFSAMYVVIGTTFLAYLLNIIALKVVAPTVASSYIYLQPVVAGIFAAIFAMFFTEDYTSDITLLKIVFSLLIFLGVYLVSKRVVKRQ